jgi:hypothetical protein
MLPDRFSRRLDTDLKIRFRDSVVNFECVLKFDLITIYYLLSGVNLCCARLVC